MALETLKDVKEIGGVEIAHLPAAIPKDEYLELIKNKFIVHGEENNTIIFKIQDGPIKENGLNGCQVSDMVAVANHIFKGLDAKFPSQYNKVTTGALDIALEAQDMRTKDRERRNVEGKSLQ